MILIREERRISENRTSGIDAMLYCNLQDIQDQVATYKPILCICAAATLIIELFVAVTLV